MAEPVAKMDNFERHFWLTVGGGMGVAVTAAAGWPVGLGWLIGWGGGGLLLFGFVTGRIVLRRGGSA